MQKSATPPHPSRWNLAVPTQQKSRDNFTANVVHIIQQGPTFLLLCPSHIGGWLISRETIFINSITLSEPTLRYNWTKSIKCVNSFRMKKMIPGRFFVSFDAFLLWNSFRRNISTWDTSKLNSINAELRVFCIKNMSLRSVFRLSPSPNIDFIRPVRRNSERFGIYCQVNHCTHMYFWSIPTTTCYKL